MNTPNNLEWLTDVLDAFANECIQYTYEANNLKKQLKSTDYKPRMKYSEAKQTIATKLAEAEQRGYGALYQFLISRLDVRTGSIPLSSRQLAMFHAEYIATLTNDKEQE